MKTKLLFIAATLSMTATASAEERYDHFPSLEAADMKTAFCNIQSYNRTLASITAKETLSAEDMVKVHELTYTLENAIMRLQADLNQAAIDLEEVHLAVVSKAGRALLDELLLHLAHQQAVLKVDNSAHPLFDST